METGEPFFFNMEGKKKKKQILYQISRYSSLWSLNGTIYSERWKFNKDLTIRATTKILPRVHLHILEFTGMKWMLTTIMTLSP